MAATPEQRLALLERLDREAENSVRARQTAQRGWLAPGDRTGARDGGGPDAYLPDQRREAAPGADAGAAAAATAEVPAHYFSMMKELALLGYFTSEIGCTQAQRYMETPGRFEPCVPYRPGEKAWAAHA